MSFNLPPILLLFAASVHSSPVVNGKDACNDVLSWNPTECSNLLSLGSSSSNKRFSTSYPYVVHIEPAYTSSEDGKNYSRECAGIIVEENIILTVGHCLDITGSWISSITISAGVKDLNRDRNLGQFQQAKAYKVHENYVARKKKWNRKYYLYDNDLAVIWLKEPFQMTSRVQKAQLSTDSKINGKMGIALGWGTNERGIKPSILQKVELEAIKNSECEKLMKTSSISDRAFCVISRSKTCGVSTGDSGGPFIIHNVVHGLVSYGKTIDYTREDDGEVVSICNTNYPQVFTDLYKYSSWIKKTLKSGPPTKLCKKYEKACAF